MADTRLSDVLHVLVHLAEMDGPTTSDALAAIMSSHPVVVRRILAGLRGRGVVRSIRGPGGGWVLSCELSSVSLRDVYEAIGSPRLFALDHRNAQSGCLVEQVVTESLEDAFERARTLLLERFEQVRLSTLSEQFHERYERLRADGKTPSKKARRP